MNNHPGKIQFQFTSTEVYNADFRRFVMLFGRLSQIPPVDARLLRQFRGAISLTFDEKLQAEESTAFRHPAFYRFANEFLKKVPELSFLLTLDDDSLILIFLGSFNRLTHVQVEGQTGVRIGFNTEEFGRRAGALKDQAAIWGKKAGMDVVEISDFRVAVERYLVNRDYSRKFGWNA